MAEIYQNPSIFSGGYLTPPDSLIPQAPSGQNDALSLLMSLMTVLPKEVIEPLISEVVSGRLSASDIVQRLTFQTTQLGTQVPFQVPNPFSLDTTNAPQNIQSLMGNSPNTATPQTSTPPAPTTTPPANNNAYNPRPQPLFSNNNPFYPQVTSPVLNEQGQEIGQTNLDNRQFAQPGMANSLLGYLSSTYGLNNGRVVESQYQGPTRPSQSELGLQFGNSNVANAGLEYQRFQNSNNYSQPYINASFKDNLQPGVSGWNNYVNTGGQSINSAQADRLYAGNPNTDPNVNSMGQAWRQAEHNAWNPGQSLSNTNTNTTNANNGGPSAIGSTNPNWNSLTGSLTGSNVAQAQNQRAANYNNPMNFRGMNRT